MDIADSIIHEARKDRATYAAAMLLNVIKEHSGKAPDDSTVVFRAAKLAISLERTVSNLLDEELKRGQ